MAGALIAVAAQPASAEGVPEGGGRAHAGGHGLGAEFRLHASAPGPQYTVYGIDVSSHDHTVNFPNINWAAQAASGVKFSYIKATEQTNYVNPYFHADNRDSKQAGLFTGAYTYGRPDKRNPVGDANFFIDNAEWTNDAKTLVPMLDMEWPYFGGVDICFSLNQTEMRNWIQAFLDQVQVRIGRKAMIYTASTWWNQCVGNTTQFSSYPLDAASWGSATPNLPQGWSTWAIWQYAEGVHSEQGNYDKNVFNGDLEGLKRLAGVDPPPPLTSQPVAVNHTSARQIEVYANAGGALVERFWRYGVGWSGWSNFGGGLAGQPFVFQNPASGTLEVYARGTNGHLLQKWWAGGRWSDWNDLGGALKGDPVVMYSTRYGSTEIYARGDNDHLMQKFYAGGWSGWNDLGGALSGDPSLVFNPAFGTTEIYVRSGSHLSQKYYDVAWSNWRDLGGSLAGDPTVFLSPLYGSTEIYARSTTGSLTQRYYAGGWSGWNDLGGSVTGDPVIFYNTNFRSTEIYLNSGGHLVYNFCMPGSGWYGWTGLGGALTSDPSVVLNSYSGNTEIYANSNGNLVTQLYLKGPGVWSGWSNLMQ